MIRHSVNWRAIFSVVSALTVAPWLAPEALGALTTYAAGLQTSLGNPVTDIMIWETDGVSTFVDYAFGLPGSGVGILSHQSPFAPTRSLIVGQTLGADENGADKAQIVMFLDDGFAAANQGRKFSEAFPNTRHSILLAQLDAAVNDDPDALDWFENTFFPGDGLSASFATGGSFTVAEFTALGEIGGGITSGTWNIGSLVFSAAVQEPPASAADLARALIEETANDLGPFDLEFTFFSVENPSRTGAFEKTVVNNSGESWARFEILLGTVLGNEFVPSTGADSIAFSQEFLPSGGASDVFPNVAFEEDRLVFSGSTLLPGETSEFEFHVTAPVDTPFTLRQIANIPEPGSVALIALCGLAAAFRRPERRRD